jgi:hypothetical protein
VHLVDPGTGPDDTIAVYLTRNIWEGLAPGTEKLLVAVQGYGRFWIRFVD